MGGCTARSSAPVTSNGPKRPESTPWFPSDSNPNQMDPLHACNGMRLIMPTTSYRTRLRLAGALALGLSLLIPSSIVHAGGIIGTVRDAATGEPLGNIDLDLFDSSFKSVSGIGDDSSTSFDDHTNADGTYTLDPLPAGQYYVRVDPSTAQGYVGLYFPGVFLRSEALPVEVHDAGMTNVDFFLNRGGNISGRILDSVTGTPVVDVDLDVYAWDESFVSTINGKTDANGDYVIGPFPTGTFYLRADTALEAMYVPQFYGAVPALEDASPIDIADESGINAVDFQLVRGGNMRGMVQDAVTFQALVGMDIDVYDVNKQFIGSVNGKTGADGMFTVGTLVPGQYYLKIDPKSSDPYLDTWYGNVQDIDSATLLDVTAGVITSPLFIAVAPAGWISGSVRLSSGAPLANVDMDVFSLSGELLQYNGRTDANGRFTLGPMAVGDVIVRADPRGVYELRPKYSGNVGVIDHATSIPVVAGSNAEVDFIYYVSAERERERNDHELFGATPNPFNPRTTISFRLAEQQHVRLTIHDVRGRVVAVLADGRLPAGSHQVVWNGMTSDGVPSATGVHFMQLQTKDRIEKRKLILLK